VLASVSTAVEFSRERERTSPSARALFVADGRLSPEG